jgi:hypothetical protein
MPLEPPTHDGPVGGDRVAHGDIVARHQAERKMAEARSGHTGKPRARRPEAAGKNEGILNPTETMGSTLWTSCA